MTKKSSSQGIAHLGLILGIVVVIAAVAFGGWYVWDKNKDDTKNSSQTNGSDNQVPPTDETADWVSVTTQAGAFSMKVPDGWKIVSYPGDFLGSMNTTYAPGSRAVLETSSTDYVGHSLRFRASVTELDDAGLGPQWASPQPGLQESTENFAIGTVQGKRYKGVFTQDSNQTVYEYVFDLGNNKKLDIVYTVDHSRGDADDVATVEKSIRTIELK